MASTILGVELCAESIDTKQDVDRSSHFTTCVSHQQPVEATERCDNSLSSSCVNKSTMSRQRQPSLQMRETYTVQDILEDLKTIRPTPKPLYRVGNELFYYEHKICSEQLGADHPVTTGLAKILEFMTREYEERLLRGEIWRERDTPNAILSQLMKQIPTEALTHVINRPSQQILQVLETALREREHEIEEYSKMEEPARKEIEAAPDDPEAFNKLRLILWILGRYKEASEAFQSAKQLGWDSSRSTLVSI